MFCKLRFVRAHKLPIAWVLSIVAIVTLGFFYKGETVIFTGIAEASETVVSVQDAVEIVKVHVVPGEEVKNGDTLVELSRADLALRMNEVTRELDALEGRGSLNTATIDQKVAEVQADLSTRRNTILFEIEKINSEYKQNREIAAKLKSLPASSLNAVDSNDAMMMRIRNLQKELKVLEESANSQIRLLRGSNGLQQTSSATEADALRRELDMLKKDQEDLVITAKGDWVVATVDVRDGEKISSFNPILTLTRKSPSMIRGFINEKVYTHAEVGTLVEVSSQANGQKIRGEIVGMSSRIVPFPLRLLKTPDMPMYGREVSIRIPEDNSLLLGERVSITEMPGWKQILDNGNKSEVAK